MDKILNDETLDQRLLSRLRELLSRIEEHAQELIEAPPQPTSRITQKVLKQMLKSNIAEPTTNNSIPNAIIFLTPENEKRRNRIITWPVACNAVSDKSYQWHIGRAHV
jgi:hypothetical protein